MSDETSRPATVDGFDLTGKRALVVGAETRVGRVIAQALAEAGARLALASGPQAPARPGEPLLSPNGKGHLTISGAADDLVRTSVQQLGGLDIVVNAADLRAAGPFTDLTDRTWDALLAVNLTGAVQLFRSAAQIPRFHRRGQLTKLASSQNITKSQSSKA